MTEIKYSKARVKDIYPLRDRGWIIAFLFGFEWDYGPRGPVYLCVDKSRVRMQYIGFDIPYYLDRTKEEIPNLILVPDDPRYPTVEDVDELIKSVEIEKVWVCRPGRCSLPPPSETDK